MKTVSVLGEGAWGTAIATLLANNGHTVKLWCYDSLVANDIANKRINTRYLPNIILDEKIQPTTQLRDAMCDTQWIFEAIPVPFLRSVISQATSCFVSDQTWVILSKGIEQKTLFFPSQIIDDVFKTSVKKVVMVGPSFAAELAQKQITAVTLAAPDCAQGQLLQSLLANNYFRPYVSTDMIGAQVGAALKNVITLGIGMLDGAGYHDNAKAFFLTRGLHEMTNLSVALGGDEQSMYGLAGVGDLVLTATGGLSRNLEVGQRLGRGESLDFLARELKTMPEGINTVQSVHQLILKHPTISMPISQGIYDVLFSGVSVSGMLAALMKQPLTTECIEKGMS